MAKAVNSENFAGASAHVPPKLSIRDALAAGAGAERAIQDLVDGVNPLSTYLRYLEGVAYEAGLNSVRDRRQFRSDLEKRVQAVLAFEHDDYALGQIKSELDKENETFNVGRGFDNAATVGDEARRPAPDGFRLLELQNKFTLGDLKNAYRAAAKLHHPDVGGDTAAMQAINDAYSLVVGILNRQTECNQSTDAAPRFGFRTVEAFFQAVHFQQFAMLIDDLAADAAYDAYQTLQLSYVEDRTNGFTLVMRLCELLAAAGRSSDVAAVLRDANTMVEHGERHGLNYRPHYNNVVRKCGQPSSIFFVPNHARQAANLLRLGIINQTQFYDSMQRIEKAENRLDGASAGFEAFVRGRAFLRLPMDEIDTAGLGRGLVPNPSYTSRVESMSPAQKAEYWRAYHGEAPELAEKYLGVRLNALFRTPFQVEALLSEALVELQAFRDSGFTYEKMLDEGIRVLSFLASLPTAKRARRIDLLNSLDSPEPYVMKFGANLGIGVRPRPIVMSAAYRKFATGPLSRIERYKLTGSEDAPKYGK